MKVSQHLCDLSLITTFVSDCCLFFRHYRISSNRSRASNTGRGSDVIVLTEAGPWIQAGPWI